MDEVSLEGVESAGTVKKRPAAVATQSGSLTGVDHEVFFDAASMILD